MDNNVKMVPAICTQCGGKVEVDKTKAEATCPFCGSSFMIEKAVNNYNVQYANIEHADNVNIDVTGAVKEVLNFAGAQMNESRKVRQEQRKIDSEIHRRNSAAFFKLYGFMLAGMLAFALIAFIIMQFTGDTEDNAQSDETGTSVIDCWVNEGALFTDIGIGDDLEWKYQDFDSYGVTLSSEDSNMNYPNRLHVGKGFCYAAERHEPARCSMHPAEQGMSTMPLSHWLTFGNTFLKMFAAPFMSAFVIVPS
jgi:predicted RNA-binding Zn-ribbon protein involved in translation (DUF1610 family)